MKNKKILLLHLIFAFIVLKSHAQTAEIDSLDNYLQQTMEYFKTPGLAVTIVQDNQTVYAKGFGTRRINQSEPVDQNTLFGIGSISKSFTALSLAILVDENKLSWDDKVIKYLPEFQLHDTCATKLLTIRDLLTHRSGLKDQSGTSLWYHTDFSGDEIIDRIKYLKPASDFRTVGAYQNLMFIVAGKVVEIVAGQSWADFVRNRILKPLHMNSTIITHAERNSSKNISHPHIYDRNYNIITIEQDKLDNVAPAGSIYSNSLDMANYIKLVLNDGIFEGDTLVNPLVFNELIKPQFLYKVLPEPINNEFTSYGMGWWITTVNGHKIIEHSGGLDGMTANLVMVKDLKFGILVFTNSAATKGLAFNIAYDIVGSIIKDAKYKNFGQLLKLYAKYSVELAQGKDDQINNARIPNTSPTLALNKYAGEYMDEMCGKLLILNTEGELSLKMSHTRVFDGTLVHWQNDIFEIKWKDPRIPRGFISFKLNEEEKITGFSIDIPGTNELDLTELNIKKIE